MTHEFTSLMETRQERLPGYSYKLAESQYGLDVALPETGLEVDESKMSAVIHFADGNRRDGVGDLLEVGGIDTSRHRKNPIVLFDHGKHVQLPLGKNEDPDSLAYTVDLDPHSRVAKGKCFFYQRQKDLPQAGCGGKASDHARFCEEIFDMLARKFLRAGSIGYQVVAHRELRPDYETGTPKGLHLIQVKMLENSVVVLPANQDTVAKMLAMPTICGHAPSAYFVKSLSPYAPDYKAMVSVPRDLSKTDVPPAKWKPGEGAKDIKGQDAGPPYAVKPGTTNTSGKPDDNWQVVDRSGNTVASGFASRNAAQAEADKRNARRNGGMKALRAKYKAAKKGRRMRPHLDISQYITYSVDQLIAMRRNLGIAIRDEERATGGGGLRAEVASANLRTLQDTLNKVEEAYHYLTTGGKSMQTKSHAAYENVADFEVGETVVARKILHKVVFKPGESVGNHQLFAQTGDRLTVTRVKDRLNVTVRNSQGMEMDCNMNQVRRIGQKKPSPSLQRPLQPGDYQASPPARFGGPMQKAFPHTYTHKGRTYYKTSKTGTNIATGRPAQEYANDQDWRLWLIEDPKTGKPVVTEADDGKSITINGQKSLTDIRKKYATGRVRRLKKSVPGKAMIYVRGKDVSAAEEAARVKGIKFARLGPHASGAERVKLMGDDAAIDDLAKDYGLPVRTKSLGGTKANDSQGRVDELVDWTDKESDRNKWVVIWYHGSHNPSSHERLPGVYSSVSQAQAALQQEVQKRRPQGGYPGMTHKSVNGAKAMPDDINGAVPDPTAELDKGLGQMDGSAEPWGAQVMRRLHKDHSILLKDYDGMLGQLEHDGVRGHLEKVLKGHAALLDETEKHWGKYYKELPGLEDAGGDEGGEVPDEAPAEALDGETADLDTDAGAEDEVDTGEEEDSPVPDGAAEDATVPAASGSDDDLPPEDEVIEGMDTKGLDPEEMKAIRLKHGGRKKLGRKSLGGSATTQRAASALGVSEQDFIKAARQVGAIGKTVPYSKNDKVWSQDEMTKVATALGKDPTSVKSLTKDLDTDEPPVEMGEVDSKDHLPEEHKPAIGEAAGHLKDLAQPESRLDDEGRMKSYHYAKTLKGIAQVGGMAADAATDEPGMKGIKGGQTTRTIRIWSMDMHYANEEARDLGVRIRVLGREPTRYEGGVSRNFSTWEISGPTDAVEAIAREYDKKKSLHKDGEDLPPDVGGEPPAVPAEGMKAWAKAVGGAADYLDRMSREKAFGDPHRQEADMHGKALDELMGADKGMEDGATEEPATDGVPPEEELGSMGEKMLIDRLNKQDRAADEILRSLDRLAATLV